VAGIKPRLLPCGDIAAVVSDFEGEKVAVERENVFAHERVVQRVLQHVTPLPFRFGTLVTTERLEGYVEANRAALIKNLGHVHGTVEMSVKIIWNAEDGNRQGQKAVTEGGASEEEAEHTAPGKGAAYLAARRREILGDELLKERAEELAAWLNESVGEAAIGHDVQLRPGESLVVRAAYLVRRAGLNDYQERVEKARHERVALRFLTSGPWPPYSFSNINP
jgi:hypothetical protein